MLPASSYSLYALSGHQNRGWLDHGVSSADCHEAICNINIEYDATDGDHISLTLRIFVGNIPRQLIPDVRKVIKFENQMEICTQS